MNCCAGWLWLYISEYKLLEITQIYSSRANIAAAAGGILFFMLYLPYSFMVVWEESLHPQAKILSVSFSISGIDFEYFVRQSLISNIAFGFGCSYFSQYEETGIGAHWSNIWVILALTGPARSLSLKLGILGKSHVRRQFLPGRLYGHDDGGLRPVRSDDVVHRGRLPRPVRSSQTFLLLPDLQLLDWETLQSAPSPPVGLSAWHCPGGERGQEHGDGALTSPSR